MPISWQLLFPLLSKTSPVWEKRGRDTKHKGRRNKTHLRLMTKALMRMMRSTTLPTTDTSNTVELAPSPIMGAGTEEQGRGGRRREERQREEHWAEREQSQYHCSQSTSHTWKSWCMFCVCQSHWPPPFATHTHGSLCLSSSITLSCTMFVLFP